MANEATVIFPYGGSDPHRAEVFEYVQEQWWDGLGFPLIVGRSAEPFNRSAARNEGASRAETDVLIFADADTLFIEPDQIVEAVEDCRQGWYRTNAQFMLTPETTAALIAFDHGLGVDLGVEKRWDDAQGSIHVCTREQFDAVGGYDPGFRGWGYEDTAFVCAMNAVNGSGRYHGDVLHLWHPKERRTRQGQPNIKFNKSRYRSYAAAARRGREAMLGHLRLLGRIE